MKSDSIGGCKSAQCCTELELFFGFCYIVCTC